MTSGADQPGEPSQHEGTSTVAWESKLRALDGAVASGRLPAEDYRRQRDELLASAGQGAEGIDPFPPPFRWVGRTADATQVVSAGPAAPSADATQVVSAGHPAPSADATQVVRPGQDPETTQVVARRSVTPTTPNGDTERTQVVRLPQATHPPGPPWRTTAPPWLTPGGAGPQPQGWSPRGPDFYGGPPPRSATKVAGLAVLAVLVVALVVAAVLYFAGT